MIETKRLRYLEILEYVLYAIMHIVYSLWTKDPIIVRNVIIYGTVMVIITWACLWLIKNEFISQVGFSVCVMVGVHVVGTVMGSLAFGICIFMAAGTLLSIYGDRRINWIYLCMVNLTIAFGLVTEYPVIITRVPIEYYIMMILTCDIYLLTESYMVYLYQQRVEEIQVQNEMLSAAQKSKDEFLANMSHEIRTPMNAIVGMSELIMREESSNTKVEQYCHNIQSSGQNLLALINDILDFSKIESGKMNIIYEPYSIAATVQDVVNTSMFRRGYKDISIIVDISPALPRLLNGDSVRIHQILTNIITNAVKFTEKGFVFISVDCVRQDGENILKMSVEDSGIGIRKEDLNHLFESFQRMDTKRNRSIEGTGLGLAICKRLVELMHGTIDIESEYGKGTTVRVSIPQSIVDREPCLSLKNPEDIELLAYIDLDIRGYRERLDYYRSANEHIWKTLSVKNRAVNSFVDLTKAIHEMHVTHVLMGAEEYRENRNFFDKLAEKVKVFVVYDPRYNLHFNENIYGVHMPFCSVSIITAINGETFYNELAEEETSESAFWVPEATVLVVDDNDLNLKVVEGILKLYKARCILVSSGREALDVLVEKHVDIVFMDHMMPELDGVETTKIIRQTGEDSFRNVPIIAMTANVVNDVKQMFMRNGFQDFLPKPLSVKSVGAILKHWLPRKYIVYDEAEANAKGDTKDMAGAVKASVEQTRIAGADDGIDNISKIASDGGAKEAAAYGINAKLAIDNMGGQKDLYKELLEYCLELREKRWNDLDECFQNKDWDEYIIQVHALKGGMRSLGVEELALAAQEQEYAGKDGRIDDVIAGHGPLKEVYDRMHRNIEEYLKTF